MSSTITWSDNDMKMMYEISKLAEKPKWATLGQAMGLKESTARARHTALFAKLAKRFDEDATANDSAAPAATTTAAAAPKKRGRKKAEEAPKKKAKVEEGDDDDAAAEHEEAA